MIENDNIFYSKFRYRLYCEFHTIESVGKAYFGFILFIRIDNQPAFLMRKGTPIVNFGTSRKMNCNHN